MKSWRRRGNYIPTSKGLLDYKWGDKGVGVWVRRRRD